MNWLGILAALSGAVAVAAGAFGAHGAGERAAELLRTGGHYQLVHTPSLPWLRCGWRRGGRAGCS